MKEKWRYNVRLAGRKGVTVRRGGGQADLDTFYRIYERRVNAINFHPQQTALRGCDAPL